MLRLRQVDRPRSRATDPTYTVDPLGARQPVTVNQQAGGGRWVLLRTFDLSPSSDLTLTDRQRPRGGR